MEIAYAIDTSETGKNAWRRWRHQFMVKEAAIAEGRAIGAKLDWRVVEIQETVVFSSLHGD